MSEKITDVFLQLFCEKNSDGTKHLRLKGNELYQRISYRLTHKDMHRVASFMKEYVGEIVSLDLSYNDIGDEGMKILAKEFFNEDNNLQHINLMQCSIKSEGMKWLVTSEYLKLKSCRVNGNEIGYAGARWIASLIQNCLSLELLDIAETDQTWESIECILIVCEQSTLKVLDISKIIPPTYYTKYDPALLADELAVLLKVNAILVELHVQKCAFDGHDIDILVSGLRSSKSLQLLDLGYNRMGDLGVRAIARWLRTGPPLRALMLPGNTIRELGARALSFGMPFSKVRYLDLTDNKITDLGLSIILDKIKKYYQLRYFFIWGNTIGPITCERMERMLASGVLHQEGIDIKLYTVDGELHAAYYPTNHYKHKYYSVMDHGCAIELKIKRNKIHHPDSLPRALIKFSHIDRYPPVNESLGLKVRKESVCPEDEEN
ncbi:hypothetical protein NQ318_011701 [Aromia moschata]|uniref:Leucine-rich repeat-containing protein 34 n=1 Tax=Aromia moschata TaxID=1265417 RepID=A0AAV8XGW0_9CUCU|nr:hypothetical protein NQ318_011701 [Aromia moschata]